MDRLLHDRVLPRSIESRAAALDTVFVLRFRVSLREKTLPRSFLLLIDALAPPTNVRGKLCKVERNVPSKLLSDIRYHLLRSVSHTMESQEPGYACTAAVRTLL